MEVVGVEVGDTEGEGDGAGVGKETMKTFVGNTEVIMFVGINVFRDADGSEEGAIVGNWFSPLSGVVNGMLEGDGEGSFVGKVKGLRVLKIGASMGAFDLMTNDCGVLTGGIPVGKTVGREMGARTGAVTMMVLGTGETPVGKGVGGTPVGKGVGGGTPVGKGEGGGRTVGKGEGGGTTVGKGEGGGTTVGKGGGTTVGRVI
jgi:hypothetical protein